MNHDILKAEDHEKDHSDMEISLLISAIQTKYGFSFLEYKQAILKRRILKFLNDSGKKEISELIPLLIHDQIAFQSFVDAVSVNVTEIFRDPGVFKYIRSEIIPYLKTFPLVNIWSAGCATGEEPYSLAILIAECDLLRRTSIYATDVSSRAIALAKEGVYHEDELLKNEKHYIESGGQGRLSDYYHSNYNSLIFNEELRKSISFFEHNLLQDQSFIEAQLIICSNVLIYFNAASQEKIFQLLYDSLVLGGYLAIGVKEKVPDKMLGSFFEKVSPEYPIYKKASSG
ncbi:MAG: protein-glutamate O-methyltransferase CheR [Spirochaetia bacterium]|nr:protein-glutamate O-methyltransferase CheR [Spirochaetia bacterium]